MDHLITIEVDENRVRIDKAHHEKTSTLVGFMEPHEGRLQATLDQVFQDARRDLEWRHANTVDHLERAYAAASASIRFPEPPAENPWRHEQSCLEDKAKIVVALYSPQNGPKP